jgi:hypothetical protein
MNALEVLPAPLADAVLRNIRIKLADRFNVRGPDSALYMAGARLVLHAPLSIVVDGIGLNCTGFSYAGTLCICAVSAARCCRAGCFAACLREAFADLAKAADDHAERRIAARQPLPLGLP